jgi:hypothetical protein
VLNEDLLERVIAELAAVPTDPFITPDTETVIDLDEETSNNI